MTPDFAVPVGQFEAESRRLGMDSVRAADHDRVLELECACTENPVQCPQLLGDRFRRLLEEQRLGSINDIVRSQSVMQPARMLGHPSCRHGLGHGREECDHVMPYFGLNRINAVHIEIGMLPQGLGSLLGHLAQFSQRFRGHQLDFEPLAILVLIQPDAT